MNTKLLGAPYSSFPSPSLWSNVLAELLCPRCRLANGSSMLRIAIRGHSKTAAFYRVQLKSRQVCKKLSLTDRNFGGHEILWLRRVVTKMMKLSNKQQHPLSHFNASLRNPESAQKEALIDKSCNKHHTILKSIEGTL